MNENDETLRVRGVSWAGGGKGITRVDVSIDGGESFKTAKLISPIKATWNRNWAWMHFETVCCFDEEQKERLRNGEDLEIQLVSKAVDDNFNAQPEWMLRLMFWVYALIIGNEWMLRLHHWIHEYCFFFHRI